MLRGYDMDGVITAGVQIQLPAVVISGRTWDDYDEFAKTVAQICPVYIRGAGEYGDRAAAARFKARIIGLLGVEEFYEDDEFQAQMIAARVAVHVKLVTVVKETLTE